MESRIPVPTDNIFKFYALFGLLAFVFASGATLYVTRTTNALIYSNALETMELKQRKDLNDMQQVKFAVLEKQREIALADRNFYTYALGGVVFVSFWAMWHGFRKWQHEIQPVLDETAKTHLEIAKLQLMKLQRELGVLPAPVASPLPELPKQPAQTSLD